MKTDNYNLCNYCSKPFTETSPHRTIFEGSPFHQTCLRWHKRKAWHDREGGNARLMADARDMIAYGGKR